jgi:hypothetical protein
MQILDPWKEKWNHAAPGKSSPHTHDADYQEFLQLLNMINLETERKIRKQEMVLSLTLSALSRNSRPLLEPPEYPLPTCTLTDPEAIKLQQQLDSMRSTKSENPITDPKVKLNPHRKTLEINNKEYSLPSDEMVREHWLPLLTEMENG